MSFHGFSFSSYTPDLLLKKSATWKFQQVRTKRSPQKGLLSLQPKDQKRSGLARKKTVTTPLQLNITMSGKTGACQAVKSCPKFSARIASEKAEQETGNFIPNSDQKKKTKKKTTFLATPVHSISEDDMGALMRNPAHPTATRSSVLAWRIPGTGEGGLVGCCLWGCTGLDITEVTQQQQHIPGREAVMEIEEDIEFPLCPATRVSPHSKCQQRVKNPGL